MTKRTTMLISCNSAGSPADNRNTQTWNAVKRQIGGKYEVS